jgi:hypothetical protein
LEAQFEQAAALRRATTAATAVDAEQAAVGMSGRGTDDDNRAETEDNVSPHNNLSARARRRLRNAERKRAAARAPPAVGASANADGGSNSSSSGNSNGGGGSGAANLDVELDEGWEQFFRANATARAWRERRYLSLAFPSLAPPPSSSLEHENGSNSTSRPLRHIVEIGAGCGSSILPLLKLHPGARATVSDVSGTSLQQLLAAAAADGVDGAAPLPPSADGDAFDGRRRITAFVADGTDPSLGARLARDPADACLIMFTLSAVPPGAPMAAMMANAAASLRPGGALCVRDSGLGDMVQLRIPPEQLLLSPPPPPEGEEEEQGAEAGVAPAVPVPAAASAAAAAASGGSALDAFKRGRVYYKRGDGTLACFFSREWLRRLGEGAGLQVRSVSYATVINRNRRTGQELRRVFAQAEFVKPAG